MKLSNISVIFIIIVLPIILLLSYYISLQTETTNMQTSYTTKQLQATKEAIEAFEINTVEWNDAFSSVGDSKRRNIMASINTFTTSFANNLGIGGTSKENLLGYIPAVACTLYDGYYIYSPAETKEVIKNENGVVVYMTEGLKDKVTGYEYNSEDKGKILYQVEQDKTSDGTYDGTAFTLNPDNAKSTYEHILKPFSTYSARYKKGNIDITVNYTLDNYITIYGMVDGEYVIKSGYLINDTINELDGETLTETIAWRWNEDGAYTCQEYTYVYAEDNTKVYFDGDTAFQVSSTGARTDLGKGQTKVKYKKLLVENSSDNTKCDEYYQALNDYDINNDEEIKENEDIEAGEWYKTKDDRTTIISNEIGLTEDVSAINYYREAGAFTEWVKDNLADKITAGDIQLIFSDDISEEEKQEIKAEYGNGNIFEIGENNNPEDPDSIFVRHKNAVIKQCLISNLNQAITSYSQRNSNGEYQLPILTETDWDLVLNNVSIITFVQNIPIGLKYYNNYAIATSSSNKEYVNPNGIYLSDISTGNADEYYHMPYCEKLESENLIGYRNIDYVVKSYEIEDTNSIKDTKYYYKHSNIANQKCYYCLVQRDLYKEEKTDAKINAYKTALARERYVTHKFK